MSKKAQAATPPAIVFRPIDELVPYARNARTHSPEQIAQIAASMVEFGFTNPVLGDSDGIVAGHGRVMAARLLYEQGKTLRLPNGVEIPPGAVPWLDCTGWSKTKRRAYILADNQLALNAGWNFEVLAVELDDLRDEGFDLGLLGFDQQQLNNMIGTPNTGPTSEWNGMPEFSQEDKTAFRSIIVHFANKDSVDKFAKLVGQSLGETLRAIWYPQAEIETYADKRYRAEE